MKKIKLYLTVIILTLLLIACGPQKPTPSNIDVESVSITNEIVNLGVGRHQVYTKVLPKEANQSLKIEIIGDVLGVTIDGAKIVITEDALNGEEFVVRVTSLMDSNIMDEKSFIVKNYLGYDFNLAEAPVYRYNFPNQDVNKLPIGAWGDLPHANFAGIYHNPDLINKEQYQYIKESGINAIYGLFNDCVLNRESVIRSLDLAAQHGITYVVRDSQVTGSYEDEDIDLLIQTLNNYKNHPAYGGVIITDEPGLVSFNDLSNLHKNFKTVTDGAFYINMLPNYATKNQLINGASGGALQDNTITYEIFMREYLERVQPKFYSYDFYPFVGMEYGKMRKGYFEQMALVRKLSNEYRIPFWTFIQASSWKPNSIRVPNQIEIYWQVTTSIAMGAKGIQYFMYYTSMENVGETFVGGMVDKEGNKNPMYDYVKNANNHLINIQEVIMNSTHMGVFVYGDSPDSIPENIILTEFSGIKSISGDDMLVGLFNHKQKPAYYVVNNSFTNKTGTYVITLDEEFYIKIYEKNETRIIKTNEITLSIGAGEAVLIEVLQ